MERYSDEAIRIIDELHTERLDYQSEYIPLIDAAQRLDAYESTGMEPENIGALQEELNQYKELGDLHRLRQLVQADREGRCEILPCKIGDTVYQIEYDGEIIERRVLGFFLGQYGVSYVFHVEGFGEYRTDPSEKVYLTREAAENALKKVRKWEK